MLKFIHQSQRKHYGFFKDLLGMEETTREGQSVYLRAYEDHYHHTLKVTEAKDAGLGHVAWRASSKPALERRVKAIEASGYGNQWIDGDLGHGDAYQFQTPDGHSMEILWDVEYYKAPEEKRSALLSRPQKKTITRCASPSFRSCQPACQRCHVKQELSHG